MADNRIESRDAMVEDLVRIKRDDGLYNYEKPDGELIGDTWYEDAYDFCEGFATVQRKEDGLWNFIKTDGTLIGGTWYEYCDDFHEGFARVSRGDGLWNFIKTDGELIGDTWYRNIYNFHKGFARVQIKAHGPWYRIDTTGKLLEKLDDN